MNFNFKSRVIRYLPEEIVDALCKIANFKGDFFKKDFLNGMERLLEICDNPYNDDSYRALWKLLEMVTEETQAKGGD